MSAGAVRGAMAGRRTLLVAVLLVVAWGAGLLLLGTRPFLFVLLAVALATGGAWIVASRQGRSWRGGSAFSTVGAVATGGAVGLAMVAATYLLSGVVVRAAPAAGHALSELLGAAEASLWPAWSIALAPLIVVAEELLWRGLLVDALVVACDRCFDKRALGQRSAVQLSLLTSLLVYSIIQLVSGFFLLAVVALACGLIWSLERLYTGRLVTGVVSHLIWVGAVLHSPPQVLG